MTFQKVKKDENNRGRKLSKRLKNDLCFIWLGMRYSNPRVALFAQVVIIC